MSESIVGYRVVVTRYGGFRHLAADVGSLYDRHFTSCMGTSSWTIAEWRRAEEGHPLGLTPQDMLSLPECARCFGDVTGSHTRWVAVCPPALPIEQSIFGPFQSEEEVIHWLALNKRDGQPLQIGEPS